MVGAGQGLDRQLGPHGKGQSFFSEFGPLPALHQGEELDDPQPGVGQSQRQRRVLRPLQTQEQATALISQVKVRRLLYFFLVRHSQLDSCCSNVSHLHVYLMIAL